jgi:hypothetical protein
MINSAIRTSEDREMLIGLIHREVSPDQIIIRVEPSLNRAVDLACGEGLVERISGNRIRLTEQGRTAAEQLDTWENLFKQEKKFLRDISKYLTEEIVQDLLSQR